MDCLTSRKSSCLREVFLTAGERERFRCSSLLAPNPTLVQNEPKNLAGRQGPLRYVVVIFPERDILVFRFTALTAAFEHKIAQLVNFSRIVRNS